MKIDPEDLVIVSDTGKVFVAKIKKPQAPPTAPFTPSIEQVTGAVAVAAVDKANEGILLASLPQDALGGGCTCTLLNLRDLIKPDHGDVNFAHGPKVIPARKRAAKKTAKKTAEKGSRK